MTSPRKPDFFIVGAPKCGTTALSEYLRTHPSIFLSEPKEPNFFNRDFDYFHCGDPDSLDDYLALYREAAPEHRAIGEASVWYLYSSVAAERIAAFAPNARIIAMVRNPIALVSSLHAQLRYVLDEDVDSFEDAWDLQADRSEGRAIPKGCRVPAFLQYRAVASLTEQIRRFQSRFAADALRIIVFDDFARDTLGTYRSVLEFLDVPDDGRVDFPRVNENKVHRLAALSKFTQHPPRPLLRVSNAFKKAMGIEQLGLLHRLRSANRREQKRAEMNEAFRDRLRVALAGEVRSLSELLDRDLSHWLEEDVR